VVHEKDDGTHKPRGDELVFKIKVTKTSFARIVSQNFDKPILNQY